MSYQMIKTEQKALEINLNDPIYGTFAEIGAGQEVARNFFQAGAAAGTIAKTMSAYDKTYSDAIYGPEPLGRYVCESRLYKMLDHEWELMEERLKSNRPDATFFVFADTIQAINYTRTIKGNGWLGLRFRLDPDGPVNEMVLHVKMLDTNNRMQQEAIGILGVNMIYACFYYAQDPEKMVRSLGDNLKDRVSVDLLRIQGDCFSFFDHKLLALYLIKHRLTNVTMFDPRGKSIHASEFLYKNALMLVRGHYKPPTLTTLDALNHCYNQFISDTRKDALKHHLMLELPFDYLLQDDLENDFILRTDMMAALGYDILISRYENHLDLISYLADFKMVHLGLVIGVKELSNIIFEKYHSNKDGRILAAFGELFTQNIKIYTYPAWDVENNTIIMAENMTIPEEISFLYRFLLESKQIIPVEQYNRDLLKINPTKIWQDIMSGHTNHAEEIPEYVRSVIEKIHPLV